MKYQGVCIAVKDVKAAQKFYQDLFALEVYQDYGINIMFHGGLSLQQDFDRIIGVLKESIMCGPHNMELYFETKDLDTFLGKLQSYGNILFLSDGVIEAPWGQKTVRFYDLDGHIIEVGEQAKMVVQRFLDQGMSLTEVSKRMDITIPDLEKLLEE